ncbi:hypothetical protein [Streptomyces flavofungini]|uniref:hypothetical protein n=1 Tax=Streptomyces flavofungini TaxID=68200 RepID=UPI0025AFDBC1|nr:hypothetical protein [Streptomyces flavofungini]WJV44785.1 hypothetical protein QUY26_04120 [Streptomyces flavofungini]
MYRRTKLSAVKARTQAINRLKAVLITADPALREEPAGLGSAELFHTCAGLPDLSSHEEGDEGAVLQATRITLGLLAHRIGQLSEQIRDVDARLARLVECHAPQLLEVVGPQRLGSEASFVSGPPPRRSISGEWTAAR